MPAGEPRALARAERPARQAPLHTHGGEPAAPVATGACGVTVDRVDIPFKTCDSSVRGACEVLVHEAGHVLGIRDARSVVEGWDNDIVDHRPWIYESVMSYEGIALRTTGVTDSNLPDDPDCSPHPLDVLAVFALYRTR